MTGEILPNEATVAVRLDQLIEARPVLAEWLGNMTDEERARATEWMHDIGHAFYEQGIEVGRRNPEVTDEDRERIFGSKVEIFSQGVTAAHQAAKDKEQ